MTLLEAMQYGIPVIVPPVGEPSEIVFSDFNSYLIGQRNEVELSNQIEKLVSDKKLYGKLSKNSIEMVQKFIKKSVESKFLELVNSILNLLKSPSIVFSI